MFASITENFKTLWIDLKTMKDNLNYFVWILFKLVCYFLFTEVGIKK